MAWNEPGRGGKDPWGRRNGKSGPPDLDELLRKFRKRLHGFGGGGRPGMGSILIAIAVLIALWLVSGFYEVGSAQRGLVLQFGAYRNMVDPGLHWHLPYPIQGVIKVDVDSVQSASNRSLMLTRDQNLVSVDVAVQYRVKDPVKYAFDVRDPEDTLRQLLQSSIRDVIGGADLESLLTAGRSGIADKTRAMMQKALDGYGTGLRVTSLSVQDVQPPDKVQEAFADVSKARSDEQHVKKEADAYANQILPSANGEAARRIEEAKAYKAKVIDRAQGEADRFTQMLAQYRQTPEITRSRMYLDAMDQILTKASKVLVGVDSSSPVLYLPLDKIFANASKPGPGGAAQQSGGKAKATAGGSGSAASGDSGASATATDDLRTRKRSR